MPSRQEMIAALKRQDMISQLKARDAQLASTPKEDQVTDEMPEWLADTDRLKAKNLTNNVGEQVAFLQKQYPDAEIKSQGDKVLLRKQGEESYKVLDPSFSVGRMFSVEGLRDLGDIAGDIVQGGAEAVGAAAGAPGGLPGVMAGSGVAAGAASSAKEKLAEMLGVKEADYMNAGKDALIGAALPGVFAGAGKGIKYGAQKVVPKLYAKATGLTEGALHRIADKGNDLSRMDESGALKLLDDAKGSVDNWVGTKKGEFAKKYAQIRNGSGEVDLTDAYKVFDDAIMQADEAAKRTGFAVDKQKVDALKRMREEILGSGANQKQGIGDVLDLDSRVNSDWIEWADDVGQGVGNGRTVADYQENLAKDFRKKLRELANKETYGSLQGTSDEYSKFADQIGFLRKNFKDPKKIQTTLENIGKGKDVSLAGNFKALPEELRGALNNTKQDLDLYRYFQPTKSSILTEQGLKDMAIGKAPIEKLLGAAGAGAGYVSGGPVMGVVGAAVGRGAGKLVASPGSVKAITKAAKSLGMKREAFEKLLQERPELLQMMYGGAAAATQD